MRKITDYKQYILDRITVNEYTDCWEWGLFRDNGGYGYALNRRCHQVAYEEWKGLVPNGLEIDHLCCNTSCCNPDHLEAVTHQMNVRRSRSTGENRTHCRQGHEYTEENTVRSGKKRKRLCRECNKARRRRRDAKPERRAKLTIKQRIRRQKKRNLAKIEK